MKRMPRTLLPLLAALLAPGCLFGGSRHADVPPGPPAAQTPAGAQAPAQPAPAEPVLYARDGSVVSGPRAEGGERTRELGGSEGSRMYLLELYQQAIDEKERLQHEVEALNAALQRAHDRIAELEAHGTEQDAKIAQLESERETQRARETELAARLTTAQIGRLEAEKLLLETRIQWREVQGLVAGSEPTAPAVTPASTPASTPAERKGGERP